MDLNCFVKWPCYIWLQPQRTMFCKCLEVLPAIKQFPQALDHQTAICEDSFLCLDFLFSPFHSSVTEENFERKTFSLEKRYLIIPFYQLYFHYYYSDHQKSQPITTLSRMCLPVLPLPHILPTQHHSRDQVWIEKMWRLIGSFPVQPVELQSTLPYREPGEINHKSQRFSIVFLQYLF